MPQGTLRAARRSQHLTVLLENSGSSLVCIVDLLIQNSNQTCHGIAAQKPQTEYKKFPDPKIPSLLAAICDGLIYFEPERDL